MISPRDIHTGNTIQTQQAIFRNIYIYAIVINEERTQESKESKEGQEGGFGGRKGKGEM